MKCKCHGVSGSCSIRTCWKGLQDLREIAIDLKTKYLSATKVVHRPMGTRKQLVPKDIDIRPVRENELVYLQSSPDFCAKNEKQGSVGTQDRWDCHVTLWLTACILSTWRDFQLVKFISQNDIGNHWITNRPTGLSRRSLPILDVCTSRMLTLVK